MKSRFMCILYVYLCVCVYVYLTKPYLLSSVCVRVFCKTSILMFPYIILVWLSYARTRSIDNQSINQLINQSPNHYMRAISSVLYNSLNELVLSLVF